MFSITVLLDFGSDRESDLRGVLRVAGECASVRNYLRYEI